MHRWKIWTFGGFDKGLMCQKLIQDVFLSENGMPEPSKMTKQGISVPYVQNDQTGNLKKVAAF